MKVCYILLPDLHLLTHHLPALHSDLPPQSLLPLSLRQIAFYMFNQHTIHSFMSKESNSDESEQNDT